MLLDYLVTRIQTKHVENQVHLIDLLLVPIVVRPIAKATFLSLTLACGDLIVELSHKNLRRLGLKWCGMLGW